MGTYKGNWRLLALVAMLIAAALVEIAGPRAPAFAAGTDYRDTVLADNPVAYWRLGEAVGPVAADEVGSLDGTYEGAPNLNQPGLVIDADTAVAFTGGTDLLAIPDSPLINLGTHTQRTIEVWFEASDVGPRQVIVEEGGVSRGLSIYVEAGVLYIGGWNTFDDTSPDTPWGETFVSAAVTAGTPHHAVLVLDQPTGALTGYMDGVSIGSGPGGTLHAHGSDTGIGAMNNASRFHNGPRGGDDYHFVGTIDEVAFYNSALSASDVASHFAAGTSPVVNPSVAFVSPGDGAVVAATIPIEVAASDPQEPASGLLVEISTDGGATFSQASFTPGPDTHLIMWDTTTVADGIVSLVARVTDADSNQEDATIGVTVSNAPSADPYGETVLADGPVVYYRLAEAGGATATDTMGSLDATYSGGPSLAQTGLVTGSNAAVAFDGVNDLVAVPDSTLINKAQFNQRTVELWFRADDVNERQVLFEEGAGTKGLSIYLDQGSLYAGGWHLAGQTWGPVFHSAAVAPGQIYHIALVLDAPNIEAFLNGASIGASSGAGTLTNHTADTGIAAMNDSARFHDGNSPGDGFHFQGVVDEVAIYNVALPSATIADHFTTGMTPPSQDPSAFFVTPTDGDTVNGTVTIGVNASDAQDPTSALTVAVSTDGGLTFAPAPYNAGSGRHELVWDTVLAGDGDYTLVANVTDTDTNEGSASIQVTVLDAPPTAYLDAVLATAPSVYWRLDESAGTTAFDIVGGLDSTYLGNPLLGQSGLVADANSAVAFDGVNDLVAVPDSPLINLGTRTQRTILAWFKADDVTARRVIVEEGGVTRGLSIYVDQGQVYVGAWNTVNGPSGDTPWGPTFHSAAVAPGVSYNVAAVLDQATGSFVAYLNGVAIGSGTGGTLHGHSSDTAVGAMKNATLFHDGSATGDGYHFDGVIDEVTFYNSALSGTQVGNLYLIGVALAEDPSLAFVNPQNGNVVSGSITVDVAASDPQDPVSSLAVDISTDGGATYSAATFNGATGRYTLPWDTSAHADGSAALVGRVTDADGNEFETGINVTVSNTGGTHMIIAAGDISHCNNTNDTDTANLISSIIAGTSLPVTVVPVGDLVYEDGTAAEFANCYEPTWGQHKAITMPVPGNHEYNTPGAAGYYDYFGAVAAPPDGWYRYEQAGWEIFALNTSCGSIGGCGASTPQIQWLRDELAASSNMCTLAFAHHPRFIDQNPRGNLREFWKALHDFGADVVVSAHAHYYAQSALQDWAGNLDPNGIRQFIAGTGGRSLHNLPGNVHQNQEVVDNTSYGVLVLELAAGSYTWQFRRVGDGAVLHSGSGTCH